MYTKRTYFCSKFACSNTNVTDKDKNKTYIINKLYYFVS